jgi:hypothetical protein
LRGEIDGVAEFMTNGLLASLHIFLVTNWTDVTLPVGYEHRNGAYYWNDAKRPQTELIGHVRTNKVARIVFDGRTNEVCVSEGEAFLQITRTITPAVITTYSTNETVMPYTPPVWQTNNGIITLTNGWQFVTNTFGRKTL